MRRKAERQFRIARWVVYRQTIVTPLDHVCAFIGTFLGIGMIGYLQSAALSGSDNLFLIGSFGASAVLIYGASNSPLAQPRNLVGGHLLSAIIGVSVQKLVGSDELLWFSCALAVALAIVAMQVSKTLHPPGGATALIANIGSEKIKGLGFGYVLNPVLTGVTLMLLVALIVNNIPSGRHYPVKGTRLGNIVLRIRRKR